MSIVTIILLSALAALLFTMMVTILEEEILYMIDVCKTITKKVCDVCGWIAGKETTITFDNQTWVYRWFKRVE